MFANLGIVLDSGKKAGAEGIISNFSFYYAHHMSTIEGGMVCTNDPDVYQYMYDSLTWNAENQQMKSQKQSCCLRARLNHFLSSLILVLMLEIMKLVL